jgi:biopolymer transport protein ExbB
MDFSSLLLSFVAQSADTSQTPTAPARTAMWDLFVQSFDVFTIILIAGSMVGLTVVFMCLLEVRESAIAPNDVADRLRAAANVGDLKGLKDEASRNSSMLARTVLAGAAHVGKPDAVRDAAELTAGEESARWFRKIDLLNTIGNLGPLVGLAGTVWGMILAFTSLGDSGGQAGPQDLSLGISKALFHTLLGLCLAIPCLAAYGIYKGIIDRACTRAMVIASEVLERIQVTHPERVVREAAEKTQQATGTPSA